MTRSVTVFAATVAAALLLSACSATTATPATTSSSTAVARGEVLTTALTPPRSLVPSAISSGVIGIYGTVAYASLIEYDSEGNLVPGLAAEWGYVDGTNTVFEFTLKPDLVFADGEPITAEAAASSINLFRDGTGGPGVPGMAGTESVAIDDLTVRITSDLPNPALPELLSPHYLAGALVSPAGVADPEALGSATFGAGPYVLNTDETIAGDTYVYDRNPDYWNADAVGYEQFVIKAIPSYPSMYQALQAGQIDYMYVNDPAIAAQGASAGFEVLSVPALWDGVQLLDQNGVTAPALSDVRVRQALNYALDRQAIVDAVFGGDASPTSGVSLESWVGFTAEADEYYAYDPDKARDLLDDAGYGDGFEFSAVYNGNGSVNDRMFQAAAQQFAEVGVTMKLTPLTPAELFPAIFSQQYAATQVPQSSFVPWMQWKQQWLPGAVLNPFNNVNNEFVTAFDAATSAGPDDSTALWEELNLELVEQAWTVPIVKYNANYIFSDAVSGIEISPVTGVIDPTLLQPAG